MRVGVELPAFDESAGGGYRFTQEMFEALCGAMPGSSHEFVFFGAGRPPTRPLPPNARFVTLAEQVPRPSMLSRAGRRVATAADRIMERLRIPRSPASEDDAVLRVLRREHIACLLHFNPRALLTPEIPYLTFVWDLEHRCQPYFPELSANGEWALRDELFSLTLPRAAAVVTGTQVGKEQIVAFYRVNPERVMLLAHPTPSDALSLAADRDVGAPAHRKHVAATPGTLIYPAQFWAHKNHVGMLRALAVLRSSHGLRPRLLLTGADHGNRAHVEAAARRLDVASQIDFLGFVPRKRLLELYLETDALVYPTTFGPENLPPLEAFALGCPVVATSVPGADEQLGDAALLVDPHDAGAMAEAIERVLTDPVTRATLIERGRARAQRWTGADVAAGILRWLDRFAEVRALWPE